MPWWALDLAESATRSKWWGPFRPCGAQCRRNAARMCQKKKRRPQFSTLAHISPPAQEQEPKTPHPPPRRLLPSRRVSLSRRGFMGVAAGGLEIGVHVVGAAPKDARGWPRRPRKSVADARTSSPSGHLSTAEYE